MSAPPLVRRWIEPPAPDPVVVRAIAGQLDLPEPLCRFLVSRGYDSPASVRAYLRPTLDALHDPGLMAGMDAAVRRIRAAIRDGETILVHGDYDVDGMCAAALYTRTLRRLGASVVPFVPHRMRDGYDLGPGGIRRALEGGATLIVTADCGIVAHEAVESARASGIDVVITDHHAPGPSLPDAVAVVNPRREDCAYPEKSLSGTGVAFKVALALAGAEGLGAEDVHWFLDLVALATVADVMPLRGENRTMTRFGLKVLDQTRSPGLRALIRSAGLEGRELSAGLLSHVLAPRLNAVGRLEDADTGLRLLLASEAEAGPIADELEAVNDRRRAEDQRMLEQALELLDGYDAGRDRAVVLARTGWHPGVIGIVASRVVERLHRPAVLISVPEDGGLARGSARSIPGFDLLDAVRACGSHLERFGGHRAAAGFDIRPERIDEFRGAFAAAARERLPEAPVPEIRTDGELALGDVTRKLVALLEYAGPFGVGNPGPVFTFRGLRAQSIRTVGEDNRHLKLRLTDGDASLDAIGFRMAETHGPVARSGEPLDVAARVEENVWRDRRRLQARLVDLRAAR